MDRARAVEVIKLVFARCSSVEGKSIKLMPARANDASLKGYQIHIQTRHDGVLESCLDGIAEENGLAVQREDDLYIIYEP